MNELAASARKLKRGDRVGPYEVLDALGAGGMGEVYRARDTKLRRDVAIKVLPASVARDPDRLQRFEREAHLLAALNHPHIAAIYGLEESAGITALVLELVEGVTLADRIAAGPVPVQEALAIARQIAEALEAAHERGIIHRDLKPANVKLTPDGTVKVLDFGLAKVETSAGNLNESPTMTAMATREGVILGTAPYMSPEQARGKEVDKRADIWAFGCVLYELLTGARTFPGETTTDVLAAVVNREPDFTALPSATPPSVRRLLARCLDKDPKRRLRDIGDARVEIDDALASPAAETLKIGAAPARRVAPVAIVALAGGAVIASLVMWALTRSAPPAPVLPSRFAIVPPPAQSLNVSGETRDVAVSPDGRHVVYRAGGSNTFGSPLMVRAIDQLEAEPLAGVGNSYAPFFSPDGKWIGFFENTQLKKVPLGGGPIITLCQISAAPLGASWSDDNTITFATSDPATGLWRVSADGGEPVAVTTPDAAQHESDHAFPLMLARGRGVLYTIAASGQSATSQIAVLDLQTGQRRTLIRGGSDAQYIPTGHLLFAAGGALRAVPFDLGRLAVLGDPVTVVEHVLTKPTGAANYAVSQAGTLVYAPGATGPQTALRSLVWVDRNGREDPTKAPLRSYSTPRLSPDGTRAAVAISVHEQATSLWIWDFVRETLTRLTFGPGMDGMPVWTPDGTRLVFMSTRAGAPNLYVQAADGSGTADRLTTSANGQWPTSITPDQTRIIGFELGVRTRADVVMFPFAGRDSRRGDDPPQRATQSNAVPLIQTAFEENFAEVSPDGRYLAYQSNESGQPEVYVRPFPQVDRGRWQVSTGMGTRPVWARGGRELFYLDGANTLAAVHVELSGSTFSMGNPSKVFDARYAVPNPARPYDVSPDGRRFLMLKDRAAGDPNATPASLVVVLNWHEDLKRLVPTK